MNSSQYWLYYAIVAVVAGAFVLGWLSGRILSFVLWRSGAAVQVGFVGLLRFDHVKLTPKKGPVSSVYIREAHVSPWSLVKSLPLLGSAPVLIQVRGVQVTLKKGDKASPGASDSKAEDPAAASPASRDAHSRFDEIRSGKILKKKKKFEKLWYWCRRLLPFSKLEVRGLTVSYAEDLLSVEVGLATVGFAAHTRTAGAGKSPHLDLVVSAAASPLNLATKSASVSKDRRGGVPLVDLTQLSIEGTFRPGVAGLSAACHSLSIRLGETVILLSRAAMELRRNLKGSSGPKAASKPADDRMARAMAKQRVMALAAKAPADVSFEAPLICVQNLDSLGPGLEDLTIGGEIRELKIQGQGPTAVHTESARSLAIHGALFTTSLTFSQLQLTAGGSAGSTAELSLKPVGLEMRLREQYRDGPEPGLAGMSFKVVSGTVHPLHAPSMRVSTTGQSGSQRWALEADLMAEFEGVYTRIAVESLAQTRQWLKALSSAGKAMRLQTDRPMFATQMSLPPISQSPTRGESPVQLYEPEPDELPPMEALPPSAAGFSLLFGASMQIGEGGFYVDLQRSAVLSSGPGSMGSLRLAIDACGSHLALDASRPKAEKLRSLAIIASTTAVYYLPPAPQGSEPSSPTPNPSWFLPSPSGSGRTPNSRRTLLSTQSQSTSETWRLLQWKSLGVEVEPLPEKAPNLRPGQFSQPAARQALPVEGPGLTVSLELMGTKGFLRGDQLDVLADLAGALREQAKLLSKSKQQDAGADGPSGGDSSGSQDAAGGAASMGDRLRALGNMAWRRLTSSTGTNWDLGAGNGSMPEAASNPSSSAGGAPASRPPRPSRIVSVQIQVHELSVEHTITTRIPATWTDVMSEERVLDFVHVASVQDVTIFKTHRGVDLQVGLATITAADRTKGPAARSWAAREANSSGKHQPPSPSPVAAERAARPMVLRVAQELAEAIGARRLAVLAARAAAASSRWSAATLGGPSFQEPSGPSSGGAGALGSSSFRPNGMSPVNARSNGMSGRLSPPPASPTSPAPRGSTPGLNLKDGRWDSLDSMGTTDDDGAASASTKRLLSFVGFRCTFIQEAKTSNRRHAVAVSFDSLIALASADLALVLPAIRAQLASAQQRLKYGGTQRSKVSESGSRLRHQLSAPVSAHQLKTHASSLSGPSFSAPKTPTGHAFKGLTKFCILLDGKDLQIDVIPHELDRVSLRAARIRSRDVATGVDVESGEVLLCEKQVAAAKKANIQVPTLRGGATTVQLEIAVSAESLDLAISNHGMADWYNGLEEEEDGANEGSEGPDWVQEAFDRLQIPASVCRSSETPGAGSTAVYELGKVQQPTHSPVLQPQPSRRKGPPPVLNDKMRLTSLRVPISEEEFTRETSDMMNGVAPSRSAGAPSSGVSLATSSFGDAEAEEPATEKIIPVIIAATEAVITLPHDSTPGAAYARVLLAIRSIKAYFEDAATVIQGSRTPIRGPAGTGPAGRGPSRRRPGPRRIDIVMDVKSLKVVIAQHPMEAWLARRATALKVAMAREMTWRDFVKSNFSDALPVATKDREKTAKAAKDEADQQPASRDSSTALRGKLRRTVTADPSAMKDDLMASYATQLMAELPAIMATEGDVVAGMQARVASDYIADCREADGAKESDGSRPCEHVLAASASACHLVLSITTVRGGTQLDDAIAFVRRVDPPSAQQDFQDVKTIHVSCQLLNLACRISTTTEPLLCWTSGNLLGKIVGARQVALAPETNLIPVQIGSRLLGAVNVPVRGSRPPPKYYTDLMLGVEGLGLGYSLATETVLSQLAKAAQRVNPPGPASVPMVTLTALGGGRPPAPPPPESGSLPWWDTLRYVWRGNLAVEASDVAIEIGVGSQPEVSQCTERLLVVAEALKVTIGVGRVVLAWDSAQIRALRPESLANLLPTGGWQPIADFSALEVDLKSAWEMTGGRDSTDHHLHHRPSGDDLHPPIDVVQSFRGVTWDFTVALSVGASARAKVAKEALAKSVLRVGTATRMVPRYSLRSQIMGPHGAGGVDESFATLVLGEEQLRFLKRFQKALSGSPAERKLAWKLPPFGTLRRAKRGPKLPSLPMLLREFRLEVDSSPLEIAIGTFDDRDPSEDLRWTIDLLRVEVHYRQVTTPGFLTAQQEQLAYSIREAEHERRLVELGLAPAEIPDRGELDLQDGQLKTASTDSAIFDQPPLASAPDGAAFRRANRRVNFASNFQLPFTSVRMSLESMPLTTPDGSELTPSMSVLMDRDSDPGGSMMGWRGLPQPKEKRQLVHTHTFVEALQVAASIPGEEDPFDLMGGTGAGGMSKGPDPAGSAPDKREQSRSYLGALPAGSKVGSTHCRHLTIVQAPSLKLQKSEGQKLDTERLAREATGRDTATYSEMIRRKYLDDRTARALRFEVQDPKVLLTTESRDALWCFYKHISNGLYATKFRPVVEEEQAAAQPRPTAGGPLNPGFDRTESNDLGGMALPHAYGILSEPGSPRDESTAQNELLRLLLNQDQQTEEGPSSMSRIKSFRRTDKPPAKGLAGLSRRSAFVSADTYSSASFASPLSGGHSNAAQDYSPVPSTPGGNPELVSVPSAASVSAATPNPGRATRLLNKFLNTSSGVSSRLLGRSHEAPPSSSGATQHKPSPAAKSSAVDDDGEEGSFLEYEVKILNAQINFQGPDEGTGRMLLSASSGRWSGRAAPMRGHVRGMPSRVPLRRHLKLVLDQVQVHSAASDVDPHADVVWMERGASGLVPPEKVRGLVGQVFDPCRMQLDFARMPAVDGGEESLQAGPLQEMYIQAPDIRARLDSREFELLVSVVSAVFLRPSARAAALHENESVKWANESTEVAQVWTRLADLRRDLKRMEHTVALIGAASEPRSATAVLEDPSALGSNIRVQFARETDAAVFSPAAPQMGPSSVAAAAADAVAALLRASAATLPMPGPSNIGPLAPVSVSYAVQSWLAAVINRGAAVLRPVAHRVRDRPLAFVRGNAQPQHPADAMGPSDAALLWLEERIHSTHLACLRAWADLEAAKAVARHQRRSRAKHGLRVEFFLEQFTLYLTNRDAVTREQNRFAEVQVKQMLFSRVRHVDESGLTRFLVHRISFQDVTGQVPESPGTQAGVIFGCWNPDESWERDEMIRVNASMGVPTEDLAIYDHLEFVVHPLGIHLTYPVATRLYEYFFRRDPDRHRRQEAFETMIEGNRKGILRGGREGSTRKPGLLGGGCFGLGAGGDPIPGVSGSSGTVPPKPGAPMAPRPGYGGLSREPSVVGLGDRASVPALMNPMGPAVNGRPDMREPFAVQRLGVPVVPPAQTTASVVGRRRRMLQGLDVSDLRTASSAGGPRPLMSNNDPNVKPGGAVATPPKGIIEMRASNGVSNARGTPQSVGPGAGFPPTARSPSLGQGIRRASLVPSDDPAPQSVTVDVIMATGGDSMAAATVAIHQRMTTAARSLLDKPNTLRELASNGGVSASFDIASSPGSTGKKGKQRKSRKNRFVYVRFNRVYARVSYQGYPLSFTDMKVVLDARVYQALDGSLRELFLRYLWDAIKSILRSMARLQGRKFRDVLPEPAEQPAEGLEMGVEVSPAGRGGLLAFFKKPRLVVRPEAGPPPPVIDQSAETSVHRSHIIAAPGLGAVGAGVDAVKGLVGGQVKAVKELLKERELESKKKALFGSRYMDKAKK